MNASILITSYKRTNLLNYGLMSLARQDLGGYSMEVIVLNDGIKDDTEAICNRYKDRLNIKYVFTGHRNETEETWRVPGFAFNIGAKIATGDLLFFSCAEMYHMHNHNVRNMILDIYGHETIKCTARGKDDRSCNFLNNLDKNGDDANIRLYNEAEPLNMSIPFFMGYRRKHFHNIGGYDEDFTGIAYEDNDIVERLDNMGIRLSYSNADVIHLYHSRDNTFYDSHEFHRRLNYNKALYEARRGIILRNVGKKWGSIPE